MTLLNGTPALISTKNVSTGIRLDSKLKTISMYKSSKNTSSMQKRVAALKNVAGTTSQLHESQSTIGRLMCHKTRNLEVKRVYDSGIGVRMSRSQTLTLEVYCVMWFSCQREEKI